MHNLPAGAVEFVQAAGWRRAAIMPLTGDASTRAYFRLIGDDRHAILMHDPQPAGTGGGIADFISVGTFLRENGFSAPEIFAVDEPLGLLLIEDLGDALFSREIIRDPTSERTMYEASIDLLLRLHQIECPKNLGRYGPVEMAALISPAFDYYQTQAGGDQGANEAVAVSLLEALETYAPIANVVILRDFHAENLIWLGKRSGTARVGLLDFQDALRGHRAYDLASLVRDARRDVSASLAETLIERYIAGSGEAGGAFHIALRVQSVQRGLRILGIFARLAIDQNKPGYASLLPRVWANLARDLDHPALGNLRSAIQAAFREPTNDVVNKLAAS